MEIPQLFWFEDIWVSQMINAVIWNLGYMAVNYSKKIRGYVAGIYNFCKSVFGRVSAFY